MGYQIGKKGLIVAPPTRGDSARAKAAKRSVKRVARATKAKRTPPKQGHRGIRREFY